ncbi:MAG: GNAT family N-acetyltransferase [Hyphomicrobiaceae bacterium]
MTTDRQHRTTSARDGDIVLRPHRVGDLGFVVHRHAVLYNAEYGFDAAFEALVSRIAAEFLDTFDPATMWSGIAERDGAIVGSAFVVRVTPDVAKLRLVYVEPGMRGTGLGERLVSAAMEFARRAGYSRMTLWTQDILLPARRLYARLGFALISSNPAHDFGCDMVNEVWERDL